jgi:hypothetical protein
MTTTCPGSTSRTWEASRSNTVIRATLAGKRHHLVVLEPETRADARRITRHDASPLPINPQSTQPLSDFCAAAGDDLAVSRSSLMRWESSAPPRSRLRQEAVNILVLLIEEEPDLLEDRLRVRLEDGMLPHRDERLG